MVRRKTKISSAATRENARALMEVAGAGAAGFADTFLTSVSFRLRNETDLLLHQVENRVLKIRDRFMLGTYFALMVGVSTVFLVTALLLYMVQFGLSWATSFLIGGAILLVIALVLHHMQSK